MIEREVSDSVFASQNWRCCYCGDVMHCPSHISDGGPPLRTKARRMKRATVDHIVPRRDGGSDEPENLVGACNECNSKRGHADAIEFYLKASGANAKDD